MHDGKLSKMKNIHIKRATLENIQDLQILSISTFYATYQHKNTKENFEQYVASAFNEKQLLKELNNPNSYFYLVYNLEELIGYLKLNIGNAQTETHPDNHLEIERIYLQESHHGKGMGKQMIDFALACSKTLGKSIVWLGVWSENPNAIGFYEHHGFRRYAEHTFVVGDDEQVDFLLKREC